MEELKTIKSFLKKYRLLDGQRRRLLEVSLFSFLSVGITMLLPRVTQKIVDDGLIVLDIDAVILWCAFYSALFLVQIMLDYVRERTIIMVTHDAELISRVDNIIHL